MSDEAAGGVGQLPVGQLLVATDTAMLRRVGVAAPDVGPVRPGVVATGDLFSIDVDGYLYFQGRRSDVAVVRGEKVSLFSVRQAVQTFPGVVRCTPRVQPDGRGGAVLDIDIDVVANNGPTEATLRRALKASLLPAERPRRITVTVTDPDTFHK